MKSVKVLRVSHWERYVHPDCKRTASNRRADGKRIASPLPWVKCPTSHTGLGYLELMNHENGIAHFGAWILILETAATCPERGLLLSDSMRPINARELSLITRGNEDVFLAAIERLLLIRWLELIEVNIDGKHDTSGMQAELVHDASIEEEGEREGEKEKTSSPPISPATNFTDGDGGAKKRVSINTDKAKSAVDSGDVIAVVSAFGGNLTGKRSDEWIRDTLGLQVGAVAAIFMEAIAQRDPIREPSGFRKWKERFDAWSTDERKACVMDMMRELGICVDRVAS